MGKLSALDRAIEQVEAEIDLLQQVLARLTAQKKPHQPKPRAAKVTTKLPRAGELRERAILGGEPSL